MYLFQAKSKSKHQIHFKKTQNQTTINVFILIEL